MREVRSKSTTAFGYATLRDISDLKRNKFIRNSISKLQQLKTSYDQPFLQRSPEVHVRQEEEAFVPLVHLFEPDFAIRSLKLCQQVVFQVQAFAKFSKEGHRSRGIFVKLHGWDEHLEEALFPRKGELRAEITASELHHRLGLNGRTLKTRNMYNKLRLFLGELSGFNKRQQELESRFMQSRIGSQLGKLEGQLLAIAATKDEGKLQYLNQIGRTHELMLNSKAKIRNKAENIRWFEQQLGRININEFYIKEEGSINEIENYFTSHRLRKG